MCGLERQRQLLTPFLQGESTLMGGHSEYAGTPGTPPKSGYEFDGLRTKLRSFVTNAQYHRSHLNCLLRAAI